jgi:hypothetical protein
MTPNIGESNGAVGSKIEIARKIRTLKEKL